jgi:AraC family transcriptional regulator
MLLEALGLQLAVHTLRHWTDASTSVDRYTRPLGKTTLGRVISYLHDNLRRDITLAELATLSGLSVAHFCRAFRESTGFPPHRYLLDLRIEKAKGMLAKTHDPISVIATEVGYDDPSYFARLFRKQVGIAPMAYRQTVK